MSLERKNPIFTGFISSILGNLIMFAATIFLTRLFSQETFGEFRLLFAFCSIIALVFLAGRDSGIIFYSQKENLNSDSLIKSERFYSFIKLVVLSLVLALFSEPITSIVFNEEVSASHFLVTCLMIPLWGLFNLNLAALKVKREINYSFILQNFIQRLVRLPFFLSLYFFPKNFYGLALSMVGSQIVLVLLSFRKLRQSYSRSKLEPIKNFWSRAPYSFQLGLNSFLFILLNKIDVLMVGRFINNSAVAIYDVSVLLAVILLLPFNALVKSLEPRMKNFGDDKVLARTYKLNMDLAIILALAVIIGFLVSGSIFLNAFGQDYSKGHSVLIILSVGFFISSSLGFPVEFLNMNGKARLTFFILVFCIAINLLLNFFFIPKFGLEGAAFATAISLVITKIIGRFVLARILGYVPSISIRSKMNWFIVMIFGVVYSFYTVDNAYLSLFLGFTVSGLFTFLNLYLIYGKFWHKFKLNY